MSVDQRSAGDLPPASPASTTTTLPRPTPVPRTSNAAVAQEESEDFVMVPAQLPNDPEPSRGAQG